MQKKRTKRKRVTGMGCRCVGIWGERGGFPLAETIKTTKYSNKKKRFRGEEKKQYPKRRHASMCEKIKSSKKEKEKKKKKK